MTRRGLIGTAWAAALLALGALVADRLFPPDLGRVRDLSTAVVAADGSLLRAFLSEDDKWRLRATADEVDPRYLAYLLAYEDRRFYAHPGVDPLALARALWQLVVAGRIVSGGSTITMQVARLLAPRPRTLGAKLIEMARALQLERRFDKDQILGLYLTLAPFGGNLEGVAAGARAWLGKPPTALTDAEAALLVALPQSPTALRPDRHGEAARLARGKVLDRLVAAGRLDAARAAEADAASLPDRRRAFPQWAPHLAQRLFAGHPGGERIRSTIDPTVQAAVADIAALALRSIERPANIAALVVETASGRVLAWLGSVDHTDAARHGWIDYAAAERSPGSTLKPFVYGLAFDDGLAAADSLVRDRRRRFGGYGPHNFSEGFSGEVTVAEALQRSLNVPAVAVLDAYGPVRFVARLRSAGAVLTLPERDGMPGLAVALGGVATSLADLVRLYAGLARGGDVPTLVTEEGGEAGAVRLIGRRAAGEVAAILLGTPHADRPAAGGVAFKTGTSYGFRDAWAIGFDDRMTVGVWIGRGDGAPMPGRTGASAAAPVMFRIFDALGPARPPAVATLAAAAIRAAVEPSREPGSDSSLKEPLAFRFPIDGAVIDLSGSGDDPELPIEIGGGRRPFTLLVDGRPLAVGALRRRLLWPAAAPGFHTVSVLDAAGAGVSARIELR